MADARSRARDAVPGMIAALYRLMSRSARVRHRVGTVGVTAVGMFAGGGGFRIAQPTLMSSQVVVGGVTARPRAVDGAVEIRDVLDLTVTIDHNVVDGAPAARFEAELRNTSSRPASCELTGRDDRLSGSDPS